MILEEINNLIDKYEEDLKKMNYSAVDGSTELERVIEDLKDIKNRWDESREKEPEVLPELVQHWPTLFGRND